MWAGSDQTVQGFWSHRYECKAQAKLNGVGVKRCDHGSINNQDLLDLKNTFNNTDPNAFYV